MLPHAPFLASTDGGTVAEVAQLKPACEIELSGPVCEVVPDGAVCEVELDGSVCEVESGVPIVPGACGVVATTSVSAGTDGVPIACGVDATTSSAAGTDGVPTVSIGSHPGSDGESLDDDELEDSGGATTLTFGL